MRRRRGPRQPPDGGHLAVRAPVHPDRQRRRAGGRPGTRAGSGRAGPDRRPAPRRGDPDRRAHGMARPARVRFRATVDARSPARPPGPRPVPDGQRPAGRGPHRWRWTAGTRPRASAAGSSASRYRSTTGIPAPLVGTREPDPADPGHRGCRERADPARLLSHVAAQTRAGKQRPRAGWTRQAGCWPRAGRRPPSSAPRRAWPAASPRRCAPIRRCSATWARSPTRPRSAATAPNRCGSPARPRCPAASGVGAVTTGGQLHLCVHYRHALLDRDAAADFTALYCRALGELAGEASVIAHPGIILAVAATIIYNLGFILEKRALGRLPAIEAHRLGQLVRTLFTAPAWLAGFLLICCGLVLQLLVLSLEPLTVAQPLQASGVVVTILFSRVMLHERLGRAELTCIGVIAVAVAAAQPVQRPRARRGGGNPRRRSGRRGGRGARLPGGPGHLLPGLPGVQAPARLPGHRRELRLLRRAGLRVRRGCAEGTVGHDLRGGALPRRVPRRRRHVALPLHDARVLTPSACACSR